MYYFSIIIIAKNKLEIPFFQKHYLLKLLYAEKVITENMHKRTPPPPPTKKNKRIFINKKNENKCLQ